MLAFVCLVLCMLPSCHVTRSACTMMVLVQAPTMSPTGVPTTQPTTQPTEVRKQGMRQLCGEDEEVGRGGKAKSDRQQEREERKEGRISRKQGSGGRRRRRR